MISIQYVCANIVSINILFFCTVLYVTGSVLENYFMEFIYVAKGQSTYIEYHVPYMEVPAVIFCT